ncbi:MAG TPA: FkbM family methyltransferase [Acetobacteraceae bacterium]
MARLRNHEPGFHLLDRLADPFRAAVDVSANEGFYSGRLAQLCPVVHCFEPVPCFAAELHAKLPRAVVIHESAASRRSGTGKLRVRRPRRPELHDARIVGPDDKLPGCTHGTTIPCRLERLDDAVLQAVGFIRIEMEGRELDVLEGGIGILRRHRPVLLIESGSPAAPGNVITFLAVHGYDGFFLRDGALCPVALFDPARDQVTANLDTGQAPYINNFVFCPNPPPPRLAGLFGP